jgi:Domain of unknown function (DUF3520)/von Willebrand factor
MNTNETAGQIFPADPRVTAYAFGELEGAERELVEAAVKADPALQATVAELRAFGGQLTTVFADEPVEAGPGDAGAGEAAAGGGGMLAKLSGFYYLAGGLAAAGLAIVVGLRTGGDDRPATVCVQEPVIMELVSGPAEDAPVARAAAVSFAAASMPAEVEPEGFGDGEFRRAAAEPVAGFPLAVDTAGYETVRSYIDGGRLPPRETVRVGELVNHFTHSVAAAGGGGVFAAKLEAAAAPWASGHRLVRITLTASESVKGVKAEAVFNPARVSMYRLIGYEGRAGAGGVTAAEVAAGRTVTVLYEVVPVKRRTDDTEIAPPLGELLTLKIGYQAAAGGAGGKQEFALVDRGTEFAKADGEFRLAAAVAAWGMLLRESPQKGAATWERVIAWAEDGDGVDVDGRRAEFIRLVRKSAELGGR